MKRFVISAAVGVLWMEVAAPGLVHGRSQSAGSDSKTLVYADFEKVENNRPVSARGGLIQLYGYEESHSNKSTFKGLQGADPPAPELVRVKKDDPNHAVKFDYALQAPNQWAGVTVEIHGLPDVDGKAVGEDVSLYKTLSVEVYATGIRILRVEAIAGERGKDMALQYPQMTIPVRQGLNTYKVPLKAFTQPAWVTDKRVDPKDIFKHLTSINLTAFCEQCQLNQQGMVIVDNVIFEK